MSKHQYVKIKGHSNWFRVVTKNDTDSDDFNKRMSSRLFRKVVGGLHKPDSPADFERRVLLGAKEGVDYCAFAQKYNATVIVRPSGTFMTLSKSRKEVEKTVYSHDFPVETYATVVVCENDEKAPAFLGFIIPIANALYWQSVDGVVWSIMLFFAFGGLVIYFD